MQLNIRAMRSNDVNAVIDIHIRSFPGFFLTFLGHDFLALLYRSIQSNPDGIVLVALMKGKVSNWTGPGLSS